MDKPSRKLLWLTAAITAASGAGCVGDEDPGSDQTCEDGQCDGLPFKDQLNGREDPIGKFYRQLLDAKAIDSKGVYTPSRASKIAPTNDNLFYAKLLTNVAMIQGCKPEALVNYVLTDDLISGDEVFPRLISTMCSDNPDLVTNAYVATLGEAHPDGSGDLNLEDLEMFAWDSVAQKYNFYATSIGAKPGQLKIEVAPARCSGCHTTARDVDPIAMPMIPIMNELTKPWTHWNPGPGGVPDSFGVPASLKGKSNWERFGANAGAASRFEKVVRDANALRVAPARAKQLFKPAKFEDAMGLVRPLFCDEQVQYVSELATGEVAMESVVSGGIKNAFRAINATWPYAWFNNDNLQMTPSSDETKRLFIMPVRGVAEVTFEAQLQSALSPAHVLALRALDWKKPVFSEYRCDLWRTALKTLAAKPPALTGRNRDAVKIVFEEIMKLGGLSTRNLAGGKFLVMADASQANVDALKAAVAAGNVPTSCTGEFCETDASGFGQLIDSFVQGLPSKRTDLLTERDRRVCKVVEKVDNAGAHTKLDSNSRIANQPSFIRLASGQTKGTSTIPAACK